MASKRTPEHMTRLVAQWHASGESRASFARRHHVSAWSFWYWCRKLSADSQPAPKETTFLPVRLAPEPDAPVVEVVFTSGERLHIRAAAPADVVRVVLMGLRSPC